MSLNTQASAFLSGDAAETFLKTLYGRDGSALARQKERYGALAGWHCDLFGEKDGLIFVSAPGRTEVVGNHTDHNRGVVLAAAVDLDTVAAVTPNATGVVTMHSAGYSKPFVADLEDLAVRPDQSGTTDALIRGVAARMKELGYAVGGFDAAVTSDVFRGSGLSSSAAMEVLICAIFDALYNGFTVDAKTRAVIGQYAENKYFGKPCGLMDQTASSVGGLVSIDFGGDDAAVTALQYDFDAKGYAACVVSVGGEHGSLTAEYAAIPAEMKSVAETLGAKALREIAPDDMLNAIPALKGKVKDRAILRALHFFDENRRVTDAVAALRNDDLNAFFRCVIESGESSWKLLQNLYVAGSDNQEMPLALELSDRLLRGKGAWRIHGGGFAGTILAFVPKDGLEEYAARMNAVFGDGAVTPLMIRSAGARFIRV